MNTHLTTEASNAASQNIDTLSAIEIARLMNAEDAKVAEAVTRELAAIALAIEEIAGRLRSGGRLVYLGAGTSGRLGVLDASECPPTFSTPPELVLGLIAGGDTAIRRAVEGAEDHPEFGVNDLKQIALSSKDIVVGIATSGRTPYVFGGLNYAREVGAYAIGLSCNDDSALAGVADLMITPIVGPEIIAGSTRLKAGTATKIVLNMLTTSAMILIGKTYGNLMVDVNALGSEKLRDRARRIVHIVTDLDYEEADKLLKSARWNVKLAIVMQKTGLSATKAAARLRKSDDLIREAIGEDIEPRLRALIGV